MDVSREKKKILHSNVGCKIVGFVTVVLLQRSTLSRSMFNLFWGLVQKTYF